MADSGALVSLGYGAGVVLACWMASLGRNRVVMLAACVLVVDYLATKVVLQFQDYPAALWAWSTLEAFGALSFARLRLIENRPSLTIVAALYLLRAGWFDTRHLVGGSDLAYVVGTNLTFLVQLAVIAQEGADGLGRIVDRWSGDQRDRVIRLAALARQAAR